jgi:hypothetical protein
MESSRILEARQAIDRAWPANTPEHAICVSLLEFLAAPPLKGNLTLGMLRSHSGALKGERGDKSFAAALQYLLAAPVPVLRLSFEMLGDDGFPVQVSDRDAAVAQQDRINPLTGEVDEEILNKIITLFRPGDFLRGATHYAGGE